ncbi:hypothetical protein [Niallia sp. MER 6]|uniref:hypothetical protein n=1 Tax=Niallia sp. MER 6 TaxID=2939567 RepID=UPI00288AC70A|nr:hypothetical protein [Niallia sp. MER 6]
MFAIWDSYRATVELNNIYLLAEKEEPPIEAITVKPFEINYVDKRDPLIAVIWSLSIPGMGQLYLHQIFSAIFVLITTVFFVHFSHVIAAFHYLLLGDIHKSTDILDKQWFFYLPSLYFFNIYETYLNTVENNKLFAAEQKMFLINNYQSFNLKFKSNRVK